MKAILLLATLKKDRPSNTEALCRFFTDKLDSKGILHETIKLVDYNIPPGTYSRMKEDDQWPAIQDKILESDLVIFATPVWWNNHSSLMQRAIERLDELHDHLMEGKPSGLEGKAGGIIVTGDSDGAMGVISGIANFYNAIGIAFPPFASLTVLWDRQAKGTETPEAALLEKYKKDYSAVADKMIDSLLSTVKRQ